MRLTLRLMMHYTFLTSIFLLMAYSGESKPFYTPPPDMILVGSTPGDALIKSLLSIPHDKKVDFIKWQLSLNHFRDHQYQFSLAIHFGESRPNTLLFMNDGEKTSFSGTCTVTEGPANLPGDLYELKSKLFSSPVYLIRLDDNLFHLLTPGRKLMVGNGGWSYTLNKKAPAPVANAPVLPAPFLSFDAADTTSVITFDGRTPCRDFAADHLISVTTSCFKLKWKLVLNKNPLTGEPSTYTIRKVVDNVPRDVSGKWKVIKGVTGNPKAVVYQLDPGDPERSISLLVGDENVLYFLTKNFELYVGNEDFSFALNKRTSEATQ